MMGHWPTIQQDAEYAVYVFDLLFLLLIRVYAYLIYSLEANKMEFIIRAVQNFAEFFTQPKTNFHFLGQQKFHFKKSCHASLLLLVHV